MNIYATRIGSAPGTARTVHVATPEFDKAWYEAYVADRRARGVNPYGVHMDGDPMNGRGRGRKERQCCPKGHAYVEGSWRWRQPGAGRKAYQECLVCVAMKRKKQREQQKKAYESRPRRPLACCRNGHEYTPENTLIHADGKRHCRECEKSRIARARAKRIPKPLSTHCGSGHEWTPENTYMYEKGKGRPIRQCRECKRVYYQRAKAKRASIAQD